MTLNPSSNRPALGAALAAFAYALLDWGIDTLPETVPVEVVVSGRALAILVIGGGVGLVVQYVGRNAPWAAGTHRAAVAYALLRQPDHQVLDEELAALGVESEEQARRLIGLDP